MVTCTTPPFRAAVRLNSGVRCATMNFEIFDSGDESYLAWIAENPGSFVLNRYRSGTSKNYLVVHAAGCPKISLYNEMSKPGGFTTRGYIKVCSTDLFTLREYSRAKCGRSDGSFSAKCKKCNPNVGTPNVKRLEIVETENPIFDKAIHGPTETRPKKTLHKAKRSVESTDNIPFTESRVEDFLQPWLEAKGYVVKKQVRVPNGIIDMIAHSPSEKWVIEAKGEDRGGYNSAEMNFRIGISQLCSRMESDRSKTTYCLAIPTTPHFTKVLKKHRNFLVFEQMSIWLLVADETGTITLVEPTAVHSYVDGLNQ